MIYFLQESSAMHTHSLDTNVKLDNTKLTFPWSMGFSVTDSTWPGCTRELLQVTYNVKVTHYSS